MERLLVRTWNLFHVNTVPTSPTNRLEEMVRLASADRPGVLCLQELPVWALERVAEWSGMTVVGDVAAPPRLGPFPSTAGIGRVITALDPGLLRSLFSGQANAVLLEPRLRVVERDLLVANPARFRRRQARWLHLPPVARLAWARERRVCQAVRVALPDGGTLLVANLHASAYRPDARLADAELLRAAVFVDALAGRDEVCILAGDFNAREGRSWTLRELRQREWGFAGGGDGVDHVLVRGAPAGPVRRWRDERRRRDGLLLSDHAPVEVEVG